MEDDNLQKISIRLNPESLHKVDSIVDYIWLRNRSDAIRYLINKGLGKERIAVILSKGDDLPNSVLEKELQSETGEYISIAKLDDKTLLEEQVELLQFLNFDKIFVITLPEIIAQVGRNLKNDPTIIFVENKDNLQSMDALRLIKSKVDGDFLVLQSNRYPNIKIDDIFNLHISNNNFVTLNLTWDDEYTKSFVKVEGTSVTEFKEIHSDKPHLTFNGLFVAHPKFLDETGKSITHDVLPRITKEGLVKGFITGTRMPHIKQDSDKKWVIDEIKKFKKNFFKMII